MASIKNTTESGFEYEIDEAVFDDWELLEDLVAFDKGDFAALVPIVKRLLGEDGAKRLKEHCRKDGIVSRSVMFKEIMDIFKAKAKNS